MEPTPHVSSRPLVATMGMNSTPLADLKIYRPGQFFALVIVLMPVLVALVGTAISLDVNGSVPVWLPLVVFLWLPLLPAVWFVMQSVRTSPYGIAAGRPWRTWQEIPWALIERVEQSGMVIRVYGSNGQRLVLIPALLREGDRLKRQLLLRLPSHVLAGRLAQQAQLLLVNGIYTMPEGGLSGTLHARAQMRWRVGLVILGVALLGCAAVAAMRLPLVAAIPLIVVCVAGGGACLFACGWLAQSVFVNAEGITAQWSLTRKSREMTWDQVQLIEHSSRQALLRLRGGSRMICVGPALLPAAQRDLMRAFLHEYCVNRGVPIVRRTWLV